MNELIERWEEWKAAPKVCSCPVKNTPTPPGSISLVRHEADCQMSLYMDTDVGKFLDWLTKQVK